MTDVSLSMEILTPKNDRFTDSTLDMYNVDGAAEKENKGFGKDTNCMLQFFNFISETANKHRRTLKVVGYLLMHGFLIAYFAWATQYFLANSYVNLNSTTCSGYGFLMILFILINMGIIYYLIIKPYILPVINKLIWRHLSKVIEDILSKRLVKPILYLTTFAVIIGYLIYDTGDNHKRLIPIAGLFIFLLLGYIFSKHPLEVNWHPVIWGLLLQFAFGLLTIRWEIGRNIFECIGNKTTTFLGYATNGAGFVYGDFLIYKEAVLAFQALSAIYFLGFMINILYHYGIMQRIVVTLGELLQAVMHTTICESVNTAANIFLGMSEAPLLLKPYLNDLTTSEIHSIMTSGFATVSGTVLAAYISFGAEASHLITASVMSAPAALCFSKLVYPETEKTKATKESIALTKSEYSSVLDAASKGASLALEVVLGIISNLIAFIAFIFFVNGVLSWLGGLVGYEGESLWSIEKFVGFVFMPISYVMGVPWEECEMVGKLIGIKTVVNEFAAFKEMGQMSLTPRTKVIATYAICGFSNPGSIGIMISALGVLMPNKRTLITSLVFRAFAGGAIVCFMTACIAAILIPDTLL